MRGTDGRTSGWSVWWMEFDTALAVAAEYAYTKRPRPSVRE